MVRLSTGQGTSWIAQRMMEAVTIPEKRALTIARTEVNRVISGDESGDDAFFQGSYRIPADVLSADGLFYLSGNGRRVYVDKT